MTTPSADKSASTDATLVPAESSAVLLIREAIAQKADPAQLRELLAVRREWESDEARKAYNKAIADFQRGAPIVEKGDDANGKQYAALDRIWRTIRPLLTDLGLSVTWQVSELRDGSTVCHLEGMLRHRDGHGEKLTFDLPIPDAITNSSGKAVQNKAQVIGSANTYAKRYALCAALGLVTGIDDDGNGGGGDLTLTEQQEKQINDLLVHARTVPDFEEKKFWAWVGCDKVRDIYAKQVDEVVSKLQSKIRSTGRKQFEGGRWKELAIHFGTNFKGVKLGDMNSATLKGWLKWQPKPNCSEADSLLRLALDVATVEVG